MFCESIKPFGRVGALKTCQGTESMALASRTALCRKQCELFSTLTAPFVTGAWRAASSSCGTTSGRTTRWGTGARTFSTYLTAGFILDSRRGCGLQPVSDPFIPAASGRQSRLAAAGDAREFLENTPKLVITRHSDSGKQPAGEQSIRHAEPSASLNFSVLHGGLSILMASFLFLPDR